MKNTTEALSVVLQSLINTFASRSVDIVRHQMEDPVSFVQSLKLANEERAPRAMPLLSAVSNIDNAGRDEIVDKKAQGFVNRGSLLSYDENVPKEVKEDIMDVFSLAQMAASHSYDRFKDAENWYKMYVNVMMMVGFNIKKFNFLKYDSKEPSFQLSQAMTTFVDSIAGGDQSIKVIAKKTMDALKDANNQTVELFGSSSTSSSNGNVQFGTVTVDATGAVQMATIAAYFSGSVEKTNYFFVTYSNATLHMFKSADMLTFNTNQYARVRDEVQKKLGNSAKKGISKLPDFGGI
mgnify:CR=1 FL=1